MPRAKITIVDEADGAAVYLTDAGGCSWRVYDCVGERAGRANSTVPPDAFATHRHFVSQDGKRRVYEFRPKDVRRLVPRVLSSQLTAARPARRGKNPAGE